MFLPCSLLQEAIKCSLLILVEHVKKRRSEAPRKSESEVGTGGERRTRNSKLNQLHTDLKVSLGYKIPCQERQKETGRQTGRQRDRTREYRKE